MWPFDSNHVEQPCGSRKPLILVIMKSYLGDAALDSPIRRLFKGLMSLKYIEVLDKIDP